MSKANYAGIQVLSIEELHDSKRLTERVKSILEVAGGYYLFSPYPEVQAYIDANFLKIRQLIKI